MPPGQSQWPHCGQWKQASQHHCPSGPQLCPSTFFLKIRLPAELCYTSCRATVQFPRIRESWGTKIVSTCPLSSIYHLSTDLSEALRESENHFSPRRPLQREKARKGQYVLTYNKKTSSSVGQEFTQILRNWDTKHTNKPINTSREKKADNHQLSLTWGGRTWEEDVKTGGKGEKTENKGRRKTHSGRGTVEDR